MGKPDMLWKLELLTPINNLGNSSKAVASRVAELVGGPKGQ